MSTETQTTEPQTQAVERREQVEIKELKIVTSDGKSFVIPKPIVADSTTLQDLCQFVDESNGDQEFPLEVDSSVVSMVIDWYNHSIDDSEWVVPFLRNIDIETMMKIILAFHYLGNKCLFFKLMGYKMALLMRSKTPEQIVETFNLEADFFNDEDREMLAMEAKWTEESKGDYYFPPDMKELQTNHPEYFSLF